MNKVHIRSTDLKINPIGLGTNAIGGQRYYPNIDDEDGRDVLRTALDEGLDFWDTAFIYGPKRSEEIIGEILTETKKRQQVVLATKAAHVLKDGGVEVDNTPDFLEKSVDEALGRLQTDYIDLFYIHFPDKDTPKYESVGALKNLKDAGKIRAIGVSNFSEAELKEANQDGYVNVYQGEYNLFNRSAEEELFPYTIQHDISFVPFFPFASGLLAGKYNEDTTFPEGDMRAKNPAFQGGTFKENLKKIAQLKKIAETQGVEIAQLVLAWYIKQKAIDTVIPGAKRTEQIVDNLKAGEVTLGIQTEKEIVDIFQ